MTADLGPIDRLVDVADGLVGAWRARAAGSTTIGCERAILRLAGVSDIDRRGRPLAWAVVDRYLAGGPARLGGGLLLPFSIAAVEYDLRPQAVALDVAGGAIDLALEAELLADPDRRAVAEAEARRLIAVAVSRIDANRTARGELRSVLGDAQRPWVGAGVDEPVIDDALGEARALVRAGADVVRVSVPAGRELIERLDSTDRALAPWQPRPDVDRGDQEASAEPPEAGDVAPAGSQRGLARLRASLDELAAERRSYVRIATAAPALAAPEQAVVAALERVDIVEADVVAEIVDSGVAPDRALADHAFAHALLARSGAQLAVGPGPLVVGPDMARGVPASPAVLAGRALALQLVGVGLARAGGIAPDQLIVGTLPAWIVDERDAVAQAIAAVAVRRAVHPGVALGFEEPAVTSAQALWPYLLSAVLAHAGPTALVMRRGSPDSASERNATTRAATLVGLGVRDAAGEAPLGGAALEHARRTVEAALATLKALRDEGWRAILGDPIGRGLLLGADAVAERSDPFDALGELSRPVRA